jgi:general stress protein YciG
LPLITSICAKSSRQSEQVNTFHVFQWLINPEDIEMANTQNTDSNSNRSDGQTSSRGFASMDSDKQRDIASKGGKSVPDTERSFSKDRGLASEAGSRGGQARSDSSRSQDSSGGSVARADDEIGADAADDSAVDETDDSGEESSGSSAEDREGASSSRKGRN